MSGTGRPLRFLAVTLAGWIAVRAVLLWSAAMIPAAAPPPPLLASTDRAAVPIDPMRWLATPVSRSVIAPWPTDAVGGDARARSLGPAVLGRHRAADRPLVAIALTALVRYGDPVATAPFQAREGVIPPPLRPTPVARARSRLAGSAWIIARSGGSGDGGGVLLGGQLGASQAGARLTYALGEGRRVALSARIATPLRGTGKEAALGLDWQPTRLPLHLLAEQRVSLDGARGGPALLAIGGINPTPVLAGFRLEGYGEAGAIKRGGDGVEPFGDGAARVTHRLVTAGAVRADLGVGAWGAAQRGARRLDFGPTIGAVVPVATKALRITLDWRERIAGKARPGSGPALSIGTDF